MTLVKKNIVANFLGSGWSAIMSLIFVPFYIKFLGIESYGLVGIFISLQAIFALLDMGLGTTLSREMARLSVLPKKAQEMRDFVRTLEVIYWAVGFFIALVMIVLSIPITKYWIQAGKLPPSTVNQALMIIGCVIALQWPLRCYNGGLRGLQKQVLQNGIQIGTSTLGGVGAVLILWQISPTIQAFFIWQIVISFFTTAVSAFFLWRNLPQTDNTSYFRKELLLPVWRYSAGLTGISIVSFIVTQADKIILSKMLTLTMFGYYTLALVVGQSLAIFSAAIYPALFPRFCQLISVSDQSELKVLYHKGCQLLSAITLPVAMIISLFSAEILFLWTGNRLLVSNTHYIVSILVVATALNILLHLPYGLQLSFGSTKLLFYSDLIGIFALIPMMVLLASNYGAVGAAYSRLILNFGYVLIFIPVMHLRTLKGEKWRWYLVDVGVPLVAAVTIAFIWRIFMPEGMSKYAMFAYLAGASTTTLMMSAILTPNTRLLIGGVLNKIWKIQSINTGGYET